MVNTRLRPVGEQSQGQTYSAVTALLQESLLDICRCKAILRRRAIFR